MDDFEGSTRPSAGFQLAEALAYARQQSGYSRGDLAKQMGYQNLSRGGQQIQRWEAGDKLPPEERIVLLGRALDLPIMDLLNLRDQDAKQRAQDREAQLALLRRGEAGHRADFRLLQQHYGLLMKTYQAFTRPPVWAEVKIGDAGIVLAYLGAQSFFLGDLLYAWSQNRMSTTCEACGGRFRLLRLAGSPLSGRHQIDGFCIDCGQSDQRRLVKTGTLLAYSQAQKVGMLDHPSRRPTRASLIDLTDAMMESHWSLPQVLASLGVSTPAIQLTTPQGDLLASYDPLRTELTLDKNQASVCFKLWFGPTPIPNSEVTFLEDCWGEAYSGGRPVIGQLSPPRAGSWRGQTRVIFPGESGEAWHQSRGLLYDPQGRVRGVTSGALPSPVLIWLVRWLAGESGAT